MFSSFIILSDLPSCVGIGYNYSQVRLRALAREVFSQLISARSEDYLFHVKTVKPNAVDKGIKSRSVLSCYLF